MDLVWKAVAAGALLALVWETAGAQAQVIGQAERVSLYAYGIKPNQRRQPLFEREQVVTRQVIETVERGGVLIRLRDDTEFTVGPASTATLDRFVYNPSTSAGTMTVKLGIGVFRFVSGKMAKRSISLQSDIAAIGVRGTTLGIAVQPDRVTVVEVVAGQAAVTPTGGRTVIANAGQTVTVVPGGGATVSTGIRGLGASRIGPSAIDSGGSSGGDSSSGSGSGSGSSGDGDD